MTNKEKIKKLETILEYVIMLDENEYSRNNQNIDYFRRIDSIVSLQDTISRLRRNQSLKDQGLIKGEIE